MEYYGLEKHHKFMMWNNNTECQRHGEANWEKGQESNNTPVQQQSLFVGSYMHIIISIYIYGKYMHIFIICIYILIFTSGGFFIKGIIKFNKIIWPWWKLKAQHPCQHLPGSQWREERTAAPRGSSAQAAAGQFSRSSPGDTAAHPRGEAPGDRALEGGDEGYRLIGKEETRKMAFLSSQLSFPISITKKHR